MIPIDSDAESLLVFGPILILLLALMFMTYDSYTNLEKIKESNNRISIYDKM